MPPKSKKPLFFSRFVSLFGGRGSKSTVDCQQDSQEIVAGPSGSDHRSTRSVPDLTLPVDNLASEFHESQSSIRQSRSEDNVVGSSYSQCAASSTLGNQDFLRPQAFPVQQPSSNTVAPESTPVYGGTASFLAGARGFRMGDIQYIDHVTVHTGGHGGAGDVSIDGWELLLKHIAPNALHDSSARYDAPKCDEDTRVEVTGEIMDWIQDRKSPQRVLCMIGAAGAGKSALQQTVAERCGNSNILGATFFFSSGDPTRNRASTVVGTIAYQLGLKHPLFQSSIIAAVKHDPLIFTRSIQSQMECLIVLPFENLRRSKEIDIDTFPYAILIDGLDECKGEPHDTADPTYLDSDDRCRGEDRQAELLAAIRRCILDNDLPFRVFIASRPEWAFRTALEPGGDLHQVAYCIPLSDKYDASGDMRRYLQRRFGLRIGNPQWYTEDNINTLVEAASGQFIYVATVFKYISERRASPAARLKVVLTWTPDECQGARPFEALDRLYTNILLAAKNAYEAVDTHRGRDFLLLFRAYHISVDGFFFNVDEGLSTSMHPTADLLSALLLLETGAEESLISDLRSLVALETHKGVRHLRLYHKSFSDFLEAESRTKALFVSYSRVLVHLAKCCMQLIIRCPLDFDSLPANWEELPLPVRHRDSLMGALDFLPCCLLGTTDIDGESEVLEFTQNGGWQKINNLLPLTYRRKKWLYKYFVRSWIKLLSQFTDKVEARKPEVAAAISEFVEKWKCDKKEWLREEINERVDSDEL